MDYGQKLVTDPSTHYIFYCIVFISTRAKLLAFVPPLLYCIYSLCEYGSKLFAFTSPGLAGTFVAILCFGAAGSMRMALVARAHLPQPTSPPHELEEPPPQPAEVH